MSNPFNKYVQLVDALLAKTKAGKVPWEIESNSGISVESTSTIIRLSVTTDENYENVYSLDIYASNGTHVDGFTDNTLSALPLDDSEASFYSRMDEIYSLGRRQAIGADKAIDDFLKDLADDKLGVPF